VGSGRTVPLPDRRAKHTLDREHQVFRAAVLERAGYQCERCGAYDVRLIADHIIEVRDGGTHDPDNGQALCDSCHRKKTIKARALRAGVIY
jgi:5-methylcytosine-specific restriction endonuclease McrA